MFFYGSTNAKVLELHPPFLETTPSFTSIAEARGMDVLVMFGELVRLHELYRAHSDYRIDVDGVDRVLASWGVS